jgi:PII-like signaling protein
MHGFKGERVLMRIHIGERDKFDGKPLYQEIIHLLRQRKYAGATAFRGIMSFGANSKIHSDRFLELSLDLPIVIECVETEERIKAILPELDNMIEGGLITIERAKVIMYRPHAREDEEADDWSLDVTGSWPTVRPDDQAR